MKKFLIFKIGAFIFLSINIYGSPVYCQLKEIKLKPIYTLGSTAEDAPPELSFYWPIDVDTDDEGNIYILDSGNQRVVKFDKDYNFILEFGREGQGPGEFKFSPGGMNSGAIALWKDKVFVLDNMNSRVQIFNHNGEYLKGFKLPWISNCIDTDGEGNCYVSSVRASKNGDLIHVFDRNGNYRRSFVKKLIRKRTKLAFNNIKFSVNKEGEVYVGFINWPIIRKYDKSGNLIFEKQIEFSTPESKNKAKHAKFFDVNPKFFEKNPNDEEHRLSLVVLDVQASSKTGCYFLLGISRIIFIDEKGKTKKVYYISLKNKEVILDFCTDKSDHNFYGLNTIDFKLCTFSLPLIQ